MSVMLLKNRKNATTYFAYVGEVERRLKKAAKSVDLKVAQHKRKYLGTNNHVLGLTVPQQRQILKDGYSFSNLPLDQQLVIWDAVWRKAKYHEAKMQALYWLSNIKHMDTLIAFWDTINTWVTDIDSWDTSDNLSSVFARILESASDVVYPQLEKWNISKNPWARRQSIVSLLYFSSLRSNILHHGQILPLIEKLIEDEDKFVQKGVGWTLRECHSVHPVATKKFIRKHAARISATAFSAAAEKWEEQFLVQIKAARKNGRRKS